jgi:hypothetical protein
LDVLHLLGNACRHGDGPSARKLAAKQPGFWPRRDLAGRRISQSMSIRSVSGMEISLHQLQAFGDAIASFWDDQEYIYNESIRVKHPSLVARLRRERLSRKWRPRRPSHHRASGND